MVLHEGMGFAHQLTRWAVTPSPASEPFLVSEWCPTFGGDLDLWEEAAAWSNLCLKPGITTKQSGGVTLLSQKGWSHNGYIDKGYRNSDALPIDQCL